MTKLKLTRNLRRKLKQGHPWVYKDAFEVLNQKQQGPSFATLVDPKGEICRGVYDPTSSLGFRFLDLKSTSRDQLKSLLLKAIMIRESISKSKTNAYRLVAGEGDGFSGLICDVYDRVGVLQYDGDGMEAFWSKLPIAELILEEVSEVESVVLKSRADKNTLKVLAGESLDSDIIDFKENGLIFRTHLAKAQKTGFFLDQRDNREYLKSISKNKEVWNIFSYTGGFSIYAGAGGAKKVFSVDISAGAIEQAHENWSLNGFDSSLHEGVSCDAFEFLEAKKLGADMVIVDPPSMTSSKDSKSGAVKKYQSLFANAAKQVKKSGDLILSSCSSQIDFNDFKELSFAALSDSRRKAKVLRVSGQGVDHPFPHACEELRYLKFMHLVLD